MATDDPRASSDFEQLRKRGRAALNAKAAKESAEENASKASWSAEQRKHAELRTLSTWRSITPWGHVLFACGIVLMFGPAFAFAIPPLRHIAIPLLLAVLFLLGASSMFIASARRRTFAFVRSQPFPLLGYEASMQHYAGHGRGGPQRVRMTLVFVKSRPDARSLLEAVSAAPTSHVLEGHEPLNIRHEGDGFEIRVEGGHTFQGHRRWFARYVPGLCEVLRIVHDRHPIAFLRVDATP